MSKIKQLEVLYNKVYEFHNDKDNTMSSIKITQAVGLGGANNVNDLKQYKAV